MLLKQSNMEKVLLKLAIVSSIQYILCSIQVLRQISFPQLSLHCCLTFDLLFSDETCSAAHDAAICHSGRNVHAHTHS